jgi:hypothetical protein
MRLGLIIKSKHEKIMKLNPQYKKILKDEIEKNNKKIIIKRTRVKTKTKIKLNRMLVD